MKTTKNDKRQIFPSKKGKFVSFFVRFVRVFTPFHQSKSGPENHGSIHVLLLGCLVCVANLQHVALADFGSTDSSRLLSIKDATEQIRDQMVGPAILQSRTVKQILWNLENSNSNIWKNSRFLPNAISGKSSLFGNYDDSSYKNFLMGGAANDMGTYKGPVNYSMLEMLDMLNRFNGMILTTSSAATDGFAQWHNATLPEMILGWAPSREQRISGTLYTNGVLGRINQEISTISKVGSNIVDKMEWQTEQITNAIYSVRDLASIMANNQTNLMYQNTLPSSGETDDVSSFIRFLARNDLSQYVNSGVGSYLYLLPYWLSPTTEDELYAAYGQDIDWLPSVEGDLDSIRGIFYKYYGTYATYDSAFNQGNYYGQYEFEGSSNIVNQTRSIRSALTNDNPSTLLPIQGIPEISGDVADFISIKNDYADLSGPSQAEITKWAGYFENTVSESRETAGFQFGITFAGVGDQDVTVETENVDFFESINLQRISQIGNTWIGYGVSIVKGLLMLMFVWAVAEKAVGIFVNNGLQAV